LLCTLQFLMLPPLLEVYVVWHPADRDGATVADRLIDHFHGTAFSGLVGGAIEVFARSEGWAAPDDVPRPLPYIEAPPNGVPEAELTVVVPVLGVNLARAVEDGGPWRSYVQQLREGAEAGAGDVCVLPVRLPTAVSEGVLYETIGDIQTTESGVALCRDLAQAIAQFAQADAQRLKVFLSHTKRGGPGDAPEALVRRVRELILDTKLEDFFDAQDLQPGSDWSTELLAEAATGALLAIRTDLYATREWCQKEVMAAKRGGMPAVILDALSQGEERGSFLMDHMPRIPLHGEVRDDAILRALGQLVDECLKRALWRRQQQLAARSGSDVATWWAPHAPEPVTFAAWLDQEDGALAPEGPILVLHPDPPLGPDELQALDELAKLCGLGNRLEVLTPRGLAIRGG
jgi:hypothetical protein